MSRTTNTVLVIGLLLLAMSWLFANPGCTDGLVSLSFERIVKMCR